MAGSAETAKLRLDSLAKQRQGLHDSLPYSSWRDIPVVVPVDVSSARHVAPIYIGVPAFEFVRETAGSLRDDFEASRRRVEVQGRLKKIRLTQIAVKD